MLNMSRPTFIKLLILKHPYSRTGNRRKVAYADLIYKNRLEEDRLAGSLNYLN